MKMHLSLKYIFLVQKQSEEKRQPYKNRNASEFK